MSWKTWITNELLTSSALNGNFEIVKDKTDLITAPVSGDETKLLKVNGTYDGFSLAEKMPNLTSADVGKSLKVNSSYNGYEINTDGWVYNSGPISISSQVNIGTNITSLGTIQEAVVFSKKTTTNVWYLDIIIDAVVSSGSYNSYTFFIGNNASTNIIPPPVYQYQYNNNAVGTNYHGVSSCFMFKTYSNTRGSFLCSFYPFEGNHSIDRITLRWNNILVQSGLII